MLDIQLIRDNPDKIKKATEAKGVEPKIVDQVLELDKKRRELLQQIEEIRARKNKLGKDQATKGKKLKAELKKLEPELREIKTKYHEKMMLIPNPAAKDVPVGKDEAENKVLRQWGKKPKFEFKAKDHLELGESLGLIDVKRASKVSGSRFGYLTREAVLLEYGLVEYGMKLLIKEGFVPVVPPVIIKTEAMKGMGYMEHGGEQDMYGLDKDKQVLVGTAEQSIGPMHMDEVFKADELPKRYIAFSSCFRREAGSYGKDTRGIFRCHQFDKLEMFCFVKPEEGDKEHEYLLGLEEKILQGLKIPYQIVKMCTGDLGMPAARKYDLEAWLPGQNKYREVTSTSTTTDFQARRLRIKYRNKDKLDYVQTLNGTAIAMGRTIIAILENYQQKDGSIKVPEVLQSYIGKKLIKRQ